MKEELATTDGATKSCSTLHNMRLLHSLTADRRIDQNRIVVGKHFHELEGKRAFHRQSEPYDIYLAIHISHHLGNGSKKGKEFHLR
ncbi:UNVERIFIED_CONTAM: hypothetical protein NCL1_02664 [Trichonephila clavipes]